MTTKPPTKLMLSVVRPAPLPFVVTAVLLEAVDDPDALEPVPEVPVPLPELPEVPEVPEVEVLFMPETPPEMAPGAMLAVAALAPSA